VSSHPPSPADLSDKNPAADDAPRVFEVINLGNEPAPLVVQQEDGLVPEQEGRNRNRTGIVQIRADNDVAAVATWLNNYTGHTWRTHRREVERLMLWCIDKGTSLSNLSVEDAQAYRDFLLDPQPAERWIGEARRPRLDERWRPFQGPLSIASQRHADAVIKRLFNWLHEVGYLAGNPWRALPVLRKKKEKKGKVTRYLEAYCWDQVVDFLMSKGDDPEWVKRRFILMALYHTRARISELASATMANIERRMRPEGEIQWWISLLGKGDKERDVPIPHLMEHLREYRASRGLPEEPAGEDLPLIAKERGQGTMTPQNLHEIIKDTFKLITAALPPELSTKLEIASAHWLRHSSASHALDEGESLQSVRKSLGHASLDTTSIYVHSNDDIQYREVANRGERSRKPAG
jgi:site-specific recombinase XerD